MFERATEREKVKYVVTLPVLLILATLIAGVIIYGIKRARDSVREEKESLVRQYEDVLTKHELESLYLQLNEAKKKLKKQGLL